MEACNLQSEFQPSLVYIMSFMISLVYIVSSRPDRMQNETTLHKKTNNESDT